MSLQAPQYVLPTPRLVGHISGCRDGKMYQMTHPDHTVGLVVQGDGYYITGKCAAHLQAPTAGFLPAGELDGNGLEGRVESWFCHFSWPEAHIVSKNDMDVTIRQGNCQFILSRRVAVDSDTTLRLADRFRALKKTLDQATPVTRLRGSIALLELLLDYATLRSAAPEPCGHRALAVFRNLLEEHACSTMTIREMAAEAGLSNDHLRELFTREYGVTPLQFRNEVRMATARDRLTTDGLTVSEVAAACGFADASYFSRSFQKRFGVRPTQLIRHCRLGS